MKNGIINAYRLFLPVSETTPVVTLHEGDTPLIEVPRLANAIHPDLTLYLKYEGMNPTGSFKDRGMTMAITKAVEEGSKAVVCASTGNTSAAAAAYAARAGLDCVVLLPRGEVALGKLSQALIHGAKVVAIDGNFDDALNLVREISALYPITLVNSVNPYRIEGQKTGAFEICDVLGDAPDFLAIPVGNAGNITAYWKGFKEYQTAGKSRNLPKMIGFQAAGAAPIVDGHPIAAPDTIATAIRIGNPASWKGALMARDESGGLIGKVTDAEILEAYAMVARLEGVFVEPACAAPIAGLRKLAAQGYFTRPARVVAIMTGTGLKDPEPGHQEHRASRHSSCDDGRDCPRAGLLAKGRRLSMSQKYSYRIDHEQSIDLKDFDPDVRDKIGKDKALERVGALGQQLAELQETLYAAATHSVLIVLQGMDTSGKDGTISHVFSFVNPQGCAVAAFKQPTPIESAHDFLWRVHQQTPSLGMMTIFNRSHYEDVLVVRVHDLVPKPVWEKRYEEIVRFESLLHASNTIVLKFYLHITSDEQEKRLLAREDETDKSWKLSAADWTERQYWDKYMAAYGDAVGLCARPEAPWHIVPSNHKWYRNLAIAETLVDVLKPYNAGWQQRLKEIGKQRKAELAQARKQDKKDAPKGAPGG